MAVCRRSLSPAACHPNSLLSLPPKMPTPATKVALQALSLLLSYPGVLGPWARVSVYPPERFPGCTPGLVVLSSLPKPTVQKLWVSNLGSCRSPGCCCPRQGLRVCLQRIACRGQELSQHQNPGKALDQAEDISPQPWGGEQWGVYIPFLYLSSGANGVESPRCKAPPALHPQSRTGRGEAAAQIRLLPDTESPRY